MCGEERKEVEKRRMDCKMKMCGNYGENGRDVRRRRGGGDGIESMTKWKNDMTRLEYCNKSLGTKLTAKK